MAEQSSLKENKKTILGKAGGENASFRETQIATKVTREELREITGVRYRERWLVID